MARSRIIGIDPGITGAVVLLDGDGAMTQCIRTPVYTDDGKKHYDIPGMREVLMRASHEKGEPLAGIEKVGTLPRDGRVGAFNFGVGYGLWLGILSALFIPYMEITPQLWQSRMLSGLPRGPKVKASAVRAAKSLFPHIPIEFKVDWGMADAALIAEYARRRDLGVH